MKRCIKSLKGLIPAVKIAVSSLVFCIFPTEKRAASSVATGSVWTSQVGVWKKRYRKTKPKVKFFSLMPFILKVSEIYVRIIKTRMLVIKGFRNSNKMYFLINFIY